MPWKDLLLFTIEIDDQRSTENLLLGGHSVDDSDTGGPIPLHLAVETNNYAICRLLIQFGANVNKQDSDGNSALHLALTKEVGFEILHMLIENGANVNIRNENNETPLVKCAKYGHVDTIINFIKLERDFPFCRDRDGNSLLHILIDHHEDEDDEDFWPTVLETLRSVDIDINVKNAYGRTPLHFAAFHLDENSNVLRGILSAFSTVDPMITDDDGCNFLHLGLKCCEVQEYDDTGQFITDLLEGQLQFCSSASVKQLLISRDIKGNTPLCYYFLYHDHIISVAIIESFLNAGANVNNSDNHGSTPLHKFCGSISDDKEEADIVKLLVNSGANINCQTIDGESPIFFATQAERVRALLDLGAEVNIRDKVGQTPLLAQIREPSEDAIRVIESFLNAGANVNNSDNFGSTPLHKFCGSISDDEEEADIVKLLVNSGANINCQTIDGESPIFFATQAERVRALLDLGAEVNIRDKVGQTPLLAQIREPSEDAVRVIELLLANGSNINVKDKFESTVLHYAAFHNTCSDIVSKLINAGARRNACDRNGNRPCDIAFWFGNEALFKQLCTCHRHTEATSNRMFWKSRETKYEDLIKSDSKELHAVINERKGVRHEIKNILIYPGLGNIKNPELDNIKYQEETKMVKSTVKKLVQKICKRISELDDRFTNTLVQSGSTCEGTKVGQPDEFDFICLLDNLDDLCDIDEKKTATDDGFAYLKMKKSCVLRYRSFFDANGYLDTDKVRGKFTKLLERILGENELWNSPNLYFIVSSKFSVRSPVCSFSIVVFCCLYKGLTISIDLVPAFRKRGWWPRNFNVPVCSSIQEEDLKQGCLLLLQTEQNQHGTPISKVRVSMAPLEFRCLKGLPKTALDAYIFAKIICDDRICPNIAFDEIVRAKDVITSYMLKNCLLHVYYDMYNSDIQSSEDKLGITLNIFRKLLICAQQRELPSFFLPDQNIFTFQNYKFEFHGAEQIGDNDQECVYRCTFAKLILNILGEEHNMEEI